MGVAIPDSSFNMDPQLTDNSVNSAPETEALATSEEIHCEKKIVYAPDGGVFFEWDSDSAGHRFWFRTNEGTEEHLEFQSSLPSTLEMIDYTTTREQLATDLPQWKGALRTILQNHPLGLSKAALVKKLYKIVRAKLQDIVPDYQTYRGFVKKESDLIVAKAIPFPNMKGNLYFLANETTRNLDIKKLVARLSHRIKVTVSLNDGILKASDVFEQLQSLFGLNLDPKDWDFKSAEGMVEAILLLEPQSDIQSTSLIEIQEDKSENSVHLLFSDASSVEVGRILSNHKNLKRKLAKKRTFKSLNRGYVRFGSHLPLVSTCIEERDSHECCCTTIYSPLHFFVHLTSSWDQMEIFQETLGKYFETDEKDNLPPVVPIQYLRKGMYLTAFFRDEWHRAIVTEKYNEKTHKCKVNLTEFGDDVRLPARNLRMLPKAMFAEFWAQAIKCKLHFSERELNYLAFLKEQGKFNIVRRAFLDIVSSKKFAVHFQNHVQVNETEFIWEVNMSCVEKIVGEKLELTADAEMYGGVAGQLIRKLVNIEPFPVSLLTD